jgi:hypothetical protein
MHIMPLNSMHHCICLKELLHGAGCAACRFGQMSIDNQRMDALLGPIMAHQFNISRQQMKRGMVYKGSGYRWALLSL